MKRILTLSPDTFLWTIEQNGLIYESKLHNAFEFKVTPPLFNICQQLLNYDNLYSVEYDDTTEDSSVIGFIEKITSIGAGKSHTEENNILSFPPLLNIQHDFARQKWDYESQDYALRNLTKLILLVGGKCPENDFYKQTAYPINSEEIIHYKDIKRLIESINSPYLTEISVVFSDIAGYKHLSALIDFLSSLKSNVTICIRANDCFNENLATYAHNTNIRIKLLYPPGYEPVYFVPCNHNFLHAFLISSESDYKTAEKISSYYSADMVEYIPIFDGRNTEFFRKYVFLTKDEILASKLSRRNIFIHEVLNTNYFGTFYVMPNKKIYSDVSGPELGNISDSIYDLILQYFGYFL